MNTNRNNNNNNQESGERGLLQTIIHEGLKPDSGTSKDARLIAASILSLNKTLNILVNMVLDSNDQYPTSKDRPDYRERKERAETPATPADVASSESPKNS